MYVICQKGLNSTEVRTVKLHCLMQSPPIEVRALAPDELLTCDFAQCRLVVGTVEFVQAALELQNGPTLANMSYPQELHPFLHRELRALATPAAAQAHLETVPPPFFIKPMQTKKFTGFVFKGLDFSAYDEHDREQLERFLAEPCAIWVSPVVQFLCEWRYYVLNGQVIGYARYDPDGADDAPTPELSDVMRACAQYHGAPASYSLDFGVMANGQTCLIEANDGWALGLYSKAVSPAVYFEMLCARYSEILART